MNDENTAKRLVEECGMRPLEIALETGASVRTVERWLREENSISPAYRGILKSILVQKKKGKK